MVISSVNCCILVPLNRNMDGKYFPNQKYTMKNRINPNKMVPNVLLTASRSMMMHTTMAILSINVTGDTYCTREVSRAVLAIT